MSESNTIAPIATIDLGRSSTNSSVNLLPAMATRHGLIAGATGTGKTVTLQVLAEQFSRLGVPVFMADVKGDLSGLAQAGAMNNKLADRLERLGILGWQGRACPVIFWDIFQKNGIPVRTTISEVGPLLLARLLALNDLQQDVLQVVFKVADDQGLLLLDLKDLRAILDWTSSHSSELRNSYGNIAPASASAIQRSVVAFEAMGGHLLFGEPALKLEHLMQLDFSGQGVISVLDAASLLSNPRAYSTLLLWMLSELFEELPEIGDVDKPRLVFFFDEAHLLFADAPAALKNKIEQVVKLIRSKGVAIFFVTQNPMDIPESILAQLGNRVQHALRAYTPNEQRAARAAAQSFRPNPQFSAEEHITALGVGEALVSVLDASGVPSVVERVLIQPPASQIGAIAANDRLTLSDRSPLASLYRESIDRESAFEILRKRATLNNATPQSKSPSNTKSKVPSTSKRQGYFESLTKSVLRSVGSSLGREVIRGILGSMRR